jgi:hypothetical protein
MKSMALATSAATWALSSRYIWNSMRGTWNDMAHCESPTRPIMQSSWKAARRRSSARARKSP